MFKYNEIVLLFITLIAIVIGVSSNKRKNIERFSNDTTTPHLKIEYFYTKTCTKCVNFEDELNTLEKDLEPFIASGNIVFEKYDAVKRSNYVFVIKEREITKVPALLIYNSLNTPSEYTGELSAKAIRKYIDDNFSRILEQVVVTPMPITSPSPTPIERTPRTRVAPLPSPTPVTPPMRVAPLPSPTPTTPNNSCTNDAIKQNVDSYLRKQQALKNKLNEVIRSIDSDTEKLQKDLNDDISKCML